MKTTKFQLKNGLNVLFIESHKSPVVSVQMWVKNGSADEQKGEEGLSHFVEHLVFKGSDKFGPGEIANVVEAHGGELNAYTSFDQTVFYVTMAKENTPLALDVISQMMGYPKFDDGEVHAERDVVIEEIKRGLDSPFRQASQLLFESAYKAHPYRVPVIGYDKVVRKTPVKKIKDFYAKRYSPKNMFLIVAGHIESKSLKGDVKNLFEKIPVTKVSSPKRLKESAQKKPVIKVKESVFQQSILYLSFKVPPIKHKDMPALEVLAMCLGQGDSSRLTMNFRVKQALVNGIGASLFSQQDSGLFIISAQLEKENLRATLQALAQEIKTLRREGVTAEELNRAKLSLSSDEFYTSETVDGIARRAGSLQFYMGDYLYLEKHMKLVAKLTVDDILKVAQKYLNDENLVVTLMTNAAKADADKEVKSFIKTLQTKAPGAKSNKKTSPAKVKKTKAVAQKSLKLKMQLLNEQLKIERTTVEGMPLFLVPLKGLPTVSVRWGFKAGLRVEKESQVGISELLSRVWISDTEKFDESALLGHLDTHNIGFSAFAGRNSVGLSLDYLTPFADQAFTALDAVISGAQLRQESIDREKSIQLNQIKSQVDNPSNTCFNQLQEMIFAGSPYRWNSLGTEETLKSVKAEDLQAYRKTWITKNQGLAVIVGDIDLGRIKEQMAEMVRHLPSGQPKLPATEPLPLQKDLFGFTAAKKEQSHVVLAYRGLAIDDPQRLVLKIMSSILSGQGGRLFIELRDKNSLAYSVSPIKMEGVGTGYFGGYIGCSPEKVKKAVDMLKIEFKKLTDTIVPAEELNRAKAYLAGRQAIELQRKSTIANGILFEEIYGNPYQQSFNLKEELDKITAADIQKLAQKIFSQPQVLSIVGPSNPFAE